MLLKDKFIDTYSTKQHSPAQWQADLQALALPLHTCALMEIPQIMVNSMLRHISWDYLAQFSFVAFHEVACLFQQSSIATAGYKASNAAGNVGQADAQAALKLAAQTALASLLEVCQCQIQGTLHKFSLHAHLNFAAFSLDQVLLDFQLCSGRLVHLNMNHR